MKKIKSNSIVLYLDLFTMKQSFFNPATGKTVSCTSLDETYTALAETMKNEDIHQLVIPNLTKNFTEGVRHGLDHSFSTRYKEKFEYTIVSKIPEEKE